MSLRSAWYHIIMATAKWYLTERMLMAGSVGKVIESQSNRAQVSRVQVMKSFTSTIPAGLWARAGAAGGAAAEVGTAAGAAAGAKL